MSELRAGSHRGTPRTCDKAPTYKTCVACERSGWGWWWYCADHDVWECDYCSVPGGGPLPYEEGSHRFGCDNTSGVIVRKDGTTSTWCGRGDGDGDQGDDDE